MANKNIGKEGGKYQFKKGKSGNPKGRPKGTKCKKTQLSKIIKDLARIKSKGVTDLEKNIIYQLYDIILTDYVCGTHSTGIMHLYFIESDFGVKIGMSKDVKNRLKQIKQYAPSAEIIKIIPYAGGYEYNLHKKFRRQNIKNNPTYGIEWFYKNDDLMAFIESIETAYDLACIFGGRHAIQLTLDL